MSETVESAEAQGPEAGKGERSARRETIRRIVQGDLASLRVVIGLALIWAIFQYENDRFLSAENLTNLGLQITAVGLISVGIVYVLLLGEIDLSVGAVSGLAAAVMAVLSVKHGNDLAAGRVETVVQRLRLGARRKLRHDDKLEHAGQPERPRRGDRGAIARLENDLDVELRRP